MSGAPQFFNAGAVLAAGMAVELHADGNVYPSNSTASPQLPSIGVTTHRVRTVGDVARVVTSGVVTVPNIAGITPALGAPLGDVDGTGNLNVVSSGPVVGSALSSTSSTITLFVQPVTSLSLGGIGGGVVRQQNTIITPAQIKAWNNTSATDVVVVPRPGPGFSIWPIMICSAIIFNTTPYATGTTAMFFNWNNGTIRAGGDSFNSGGLTSAQIKGAVTASRATVQIQSAGTTFAAYLGGVPDNADYVVNCGAVQYTAGDSPIKVQIAYMIVPRS